jgi:cyclophilin family peptidyl-prolyl cis-trans isomerase
MAKDQQKRRRKRRVVESAYAGDVKPPGFFRLFVSRRVIQGIFILMAIVIAASTGAVCFGDTIGSDATPKPDPTFVRPDDATAVEATATVGAKVYDEPPPFTIDEDGAYTALVRTESGDFEIELLPGQAPRTVNNFVFLAREGFYDGLAFFFVDPGFSAQAGDPRCTSAEDSPQTCTGDAGFELPQEAPSAFEAGSVGMVNSSQFFVAFTDSDQFSAFTPFGRVVSGLEVAEAMTAGTKITGIEVQEG